MKKKRKKNREALITLPDLFLHDNEKQRKICLTSERNIPMLYTEQSNTITTMQKNDAFDLDVRFVMNEDSRNAKEPDFPSISKCVCTNPCATVSAAMCSMFC